MFFFYLCSGTSVCDGDSGGGMFMERDDGYFYIRGITSVAVTRRQAGVRQCDPTEYFIFTEVSYFFDWIYDNIIGKIEVAL